MTPDAKLTATLDELWNDGLLQRSGNRYETTRRWRAVRHRASVARDAASESLDLRNPIVQALIAYYGGRRVLATLASHVAVLFALESSERRPAA
jgi:hypothetical protein